MAYHLAKWIGVELTISYLRTRTGDSVPDMQWNLLVKPDASVDSVTHHVMSGVKSLTNREISDVFNTGIFAIEDNRALISNK